MSRSFKKTPIVKEYTSSARKFVKKKSNHFIRKKVQNPEEDIGNRCNYKKQHYDLDEYSRWDKDFSTDLYYKYQDVDKKKFPTLKSWLEYDKKQISRK